MNVSDFFRIPASPLVVDPSRANPLVIRTWPHSDLFGRAEDVPHSWIMEGETDEGKVLRQLIVDMIDLCETRDLYGISGPAVGVSLRLFVIDPVKCGVDPNVPRVFINPRLHVTRDDRTLAPEGCGCVPRISPLIERFDEICVTAWDLRDHRPFVHSFVGIPARCIQHEYDHLDGLLITRAATRGEMLRCRRPK